MIRAVSWPAKMNSLLVIAAVLVMVLAVDSPALTVTGTVIVSMDDEERVMLPAITGRLRGEVAITASGCGGTS